jgi:Flp pilus assembly protein TadG
MKIYHQLISKFKDQRGVTAVVVAIAITMLMGFVALAVDVGYVAATKNELQDIADASALAGAGELGNQYVTNVPLNYTKIKFIATSTGTANKAAGLFINIPDADVLIGTWDQHAIPPAQKFDSSVTPQPTAVKVTARRDGGANGPITTFFSKIFGIQTVDVWADAVAALTPPAIVAEIQLPVGLSEQWFPDNCGKVVDFTQTSLSCVGWHNWNNAINANAMVNKLLGIITADTCQPPEDCSLLYGADYWTATYGLPVPPPSPATGAIVGDGFEFQGGVVGTLFNGTPAPMVALFEYFKARDGGQQWNQYLPDGTEPPYIDLRDDDTVWTTIAPVYADPGTYPNCSNPNTNLAIQGYAIVQVSNVNSQPSNSMDVYVHCNLFVISGRGGGGGSGNTLGDIPNLVE